MNIKTSLKLELKVLAQLELMTQEEILTRFINQEEGGEEAPKETGEEGEKEEGEKNL